MAPPRAPPSITAHVLRRAAPARRQEVLACETLWVRSGKLGSQGRERSIKPSSAEGKRGNLRAELRGRAWKQIRKGYRYDPQDDQRGPLRWIVPAPDFMAIGARGLSACRDGSYAVFEQHSNGKGSRVYRLDLETGVLVIFDRRPEVAPWEERTERSRVTSPAGREVVLLRA